jgi:uncharacterized protein
MDILWTGFLFGLFGSAHCIGMCGPIAVALPGSRELMRSYLTGRVLYNLGRTVTYTLMGAVLGLLGLGVWLAGYQQALSVFTGAGIVAITLLTWNRSLIPTGGIFNGLASRFERLMRPLMRSNSQSGMLLIGVVNGFLPCGLVYVALAAALSTGSIYGGMAYMALFGLGTAPVMFLMAVSPGLMSGKWHLRLQKAIPWLALLVGALLILRGLSLGIPYISPDLGGGGSCH